MNTRTIVGISLLALLTGCSSAARPRPQPIPTPDPELPAPVFVAFASTGDTPIGQATVAVANSTEWEIEVFFETVGTREVARRLASVQPDSSATLTLPAGTWVVLRARTRDGLRELELPASRLAPGETRDWPVGAADWWRTKS